MSGFHAILLDDIVLVVEHIVSIEPVHETRGGRPVNVKRSDGSVGPNVIGSTVTMSPGNVIQFARHTPDEIGRQLAEALGGDEAAS